MNDYPYIYEKIKKLEVFRLQRRSLEVENNTSITRNHRFFISFLDFAQFLSYLTEVFSTTTFIALLLQNLKIILSIPCRNNFE